MRSLEEIEAELDDAWARWEKAEAVTLSALPSHEIEQAMIEEKDAWENYIALDNEYWKAVEDAHKKA